MSHPNPEPIYKIATGFMAAKHLFVANEVGLFAQLEKGPATLDELAARTGVPRRTLRIVVDAMVAMEFVRLDGGKYGNGEVASTFLSGKTPADLRPFLRFWNRLSYPRWTSLEDAVRGTQTAQGGARFTEEETRIFSEGVEAITAGTAQALAAGYEFGRHQRVLDVGGGTGSFLKPLCQQRPKLKCTLFELPAVAAVARQVLAKSGSSDRIAVVEGDCLTDRIPGGHDVILLANVVHLLGPDKNRRLLQRLREASLPGTRLLLVDFWTDSTHTQPAFAALMAGEFLLVSGEGDVYSEEEVREWLAKTGWTFVARQPLAGPASLIVAEAA